LFNLLHEKWIPVRRASGTPEIISAHEMVADYASNPALSLDAPRPDFNGALYQFLIGLVQTSYPPADERQWQKKFRTPPAPEELATALDRYAAAFDLDGNGPRFMQDPDLVHEKSERNAVDHLLMDMPGEQTLDKNTDHFLKRETVNQVCRSCSAMALHTLQTNAPSGGRGHRTSLRGGGPLTTLVMGRTLWETVWLNVLTSDSFNHFGNAGKKTESDIFPWLGHTRTSARNEETTSQHVHPAQMFWGTPRRIRLSFEKSENPIRCDLCGCITTEFVSEYDTKSYGVNYKGGWKHTLSPYYTPEKTGEPLPVHLNQSGISYRNWLGLVQSDAGKNSKNEPAAVVHLFRQVRVGDLSGTSRIPFRLFAFGYDMENMKARGWYEGTMPLIHIPDKIRPTYETVISQMIKTANQIGSNARISIKKALFNSGAEVRGDLSFIDTEFWQDTEPEFYRVTEDLKAVLEQGGPTDDLKRRWLSALTREGEALFDRYAQSNTIALADPKRIALARRDFLRFSSQYNKIIQQTLDLPKPPARTVPGSPVSKERMEKDMR